MRENKMKYEKTNKKDTCVMCGKPVDNEVPLCSFVCMVDWMTEQYGNKKEKKQLDRVGWETNL